jgi:hypothetical protein
MSLDVKISDVSAGTESDESNMDQGLENFAEEY